MKKRIVIISCAALIVVIAAFAVYLFRDVSKAPTDIVRQHFVNESAAFRLASVIKEIEVDSNTALVFYLSSNGTVANAVLEKGLFGYKVVNYSGEVAPTSEIIPSGRFYSSFSDTESIVWYVLYDQSITQVMAGDNEADIITANNMKIYYSFGNFKTEPRCDFYNGDELVWSIE